MILTCVLVLAALQPKTAQATVESNLELVEKLTQKGAFLTRRELCLLACAVTEMEGCGLKPFSEKYCIQVAIWLC